MLFVSKIYDTDDKMKDLGMNLGKLRGKFRNSEKFIVRFSRL